jgi:hypothetical protein
MQVDPHEIENVSLRDPDNHSAMLSAQAEAMAAAG